MRRLKGIPALVSLLDNPKKDVHHSACGALKNISYGRDHDNKIAIKNCDGIPALVRLLRKARDQDLTDTITGNTTVQSLQDFKGIFCVLLCWQKCLLLLRQFCNFAWQYVIIFTNLS